MKNLKNRKSTWIATIALSGIYAGLTYVGRKRIEGRDIDEGNPYLTAGSASYLTADSTESYGQKTREAPEIGGAGIYESQIKPRLDKFLSFCGLILLSPVFAAIALAVVIDDPGPVFFTQKRVGRDKHFFMLHKFRTMKMSTPHDVPTHQLKNPEQYITRVGAFLRKTSLDELPQIWDIFRGKMSIIGPRPALWNQEDLIAEREKYGANDVLPGLTGWAQINGRDELEINDKAELDGIYVKRLKQGGVKALFFDCRCFAGTVLSVLRHDGVVEGGTGVHVVH